MKKINKSFFLIIILFMAQAVYAQTGILFEPYMDDGTAEIEKTAPGEAVIGDILSAQIMIKNSVGAETAVELKENFGSFEVVDVGPFIKNKEGGSGISGDEYARAVIKVPANTKAIVTYKIKPSRIGALWISPTLVRTPLGEAKTNILVVQIKCVPDGFCDTGADENAVNCPEDCNPKKPDYTCNPARDNICDPDCKPRIDPDCISTTTTKIVSTTTLPKSILCKNKVCEPPDENYILCPEDCASGSEDGFCDKIKDNRCDADCKADEDSDCAKTNNWAAIIMLIIITAIIAVVAYKKKWLKLGR